MTEPTDAVLRLFREIRAEQKAQHQAVTERLARIENQITDLHGAVLAQRGDLDDLYSRVQK